MATYRCHNATGSALIVALASLVVTSVLLSPSTAHAQFTETSLLVSPSTDGTTKVVEQIDPKITVSSISLQSIAAGVSDLIAVDENNVLLSAHQDGSKITIDTLGASHVTLTYVANGILNKTNDVWTLAYNSDIQSSIMLPPVSAIVSVNSIPIDINDTDLTMPAGSISVTFTSNAVTTSVFDASWNGADMPVQVITAGKIVKFSFDQPSKSILITVANKAPVLAIIPKALLDGPFLVESGNNPVSFKQYYQNATHSWVRIDSPQSAGDSLAIIGSKVVPEFSAPQSMLAAFGAIATLVILRLLHQASK